MTSTPDPQPAQPGDSRFYPLIDSRCNHRDHEPNVRVYRAVGDCRNCHAGPFLFLVTFGHEKPSGKMCPRCGCYTASAQRLAEDDELPDSAAAVAGRGAADGGDQT